MAGDRCQNRWRTLPERLYTVAMALTQRRPLRVPNMIASLLYYSSHNPNRISHYFLQLAQTIYRQNACV
jgi:hypothetical protein